jgi:D-alanyl-D-alanine carboxypeptidase
MKQSQSPIWQKKRKRKFKNTKHIHQSATEKNPQKVLTDQSVPQPKESTPKKPFFSGLFHKEKKENKTSHKKGVIGHWFKKHDSDIQLILFPLILLCILLIMHVINSQLFFNLDKQSPITDTSTTTLHPYPYVQAVAAPDISAESAIILDRGSQVILFSKNSQLRFSMASTTKIMSAMIALSHYKSNDILTIKRSYVPGSGLNLYEGEKFRFIDLIYAMLLPSANDAAQAIADNYPGGSDAFVEQMNIMAKKLHLTNTHYSDPVGLDDDGDYSTVVDMSRLASYAISNPEFVEVTSTKYKTIADVNFTRQYPLANTNELLGIDGVTGIKTGTTEGAGQVLVTSVVKNHHTYIIVVMESDDRFGDTSMLLNFIDGNVKYIVPPQPPFSF